MAVHPPWFDPRMPSREDCVTPCLLERFAAAHPERVFIQFEDGRRWTWAETRRIARMTAAAYQRFGVKPGDTILAWLPNGPAMVRAWLGASLIGAVLVPINAGYKGRLLEHVIATSRAKLMLSHPQLVDRLGLVAHGDLQTVIVDAPDAPAAIGALKLLPAKALDGNPDALDLSYQPQLWDTQLIIFTSGTTGPSKAVQASYLHLYTTAKATYGYLKPEDCMMINLPMFHVGGTASFMAAFSIGARVALFDGFNTRAFWTQVRETGATVISGLIGAMTAFLAKNEPHANDTDNPLRMVTLAPVNSETIALGQRYAFDYISGFNMTELSGPLVTDVNEQVERSCGRPRTGVECRIVDDHDIEVPVGQIGELIVRSDRPWDQFSGYFGNPEATAAAWRNGWFHTGDLMYRDAHDNFFFVDRKKDAIRRRGENVSSIEVEIDVATHPAVREVAAYAVASPEGEDEVMIAIAPKPGATLDPAELIAYLAPRMAHFMVPRYVRIEAELPKTATNKIQKTELRAEGITPSTWDREAAGVKLKREKLTKAGAG